MLRWSTCSLALPSQSTISRDPCKVGAHTACQETPAWTSKYSPLQSVRVIKTHPVHCCFRQIAQLTAWSVNTRTSTASQLVTDILRAYSHLITENQVKELCLKAREVRPGQGSSRMISYQATPHAHVLTWLVSADLGRRSQRPMDRLTGNGQPLRHCAPSSSSSSAHPLRAFADLR